MDGPHLIIYTLAHTQTHHVEYPAISRVKSAPFFALVSFDGRAIKRANHSRKTL